MNMFEPDGRRVIRVRRPALRTTIPAVGAKIIPESTVEHVVGLMIPGKAKGERYAAEFLSSTPLPFQLYFKTCALMRSLNPAFADLWQDVELYEYKNQALRWAFKRLIIFRRPTTIFANETDVGAMIPVSEISDIDKVLFYDSKARRHYIMHAQTAAGILRMALESQDHMFPTPRVPKNPYTNNPFGYGQLSVIYTQLNMRYERFPVVP